MPSNKFAKRRRAAQFRALGCTQRMWEMIRQQILERDGHRCVLCGRRGRLEVDHIKPLAWGGNNDPDNLRALCRDCHFQATRETVRAAKPHHRPEWEQMLKEVMT